MVCTYIYTQLRPCTVYIFEVCLCIECLSPTELLSFLGSSVSVLLTELLSFLGSSVRRTLCVYVLWARIPPRWSFLKIFYRCKKALSWVSVACLVTACALQRRSKLVWRRENSPTTILITFTTLYIAGVWSVIILLNYSYFLQGSGGKDRQTNHTEYLDNSRSMQYN